MKQCKIVHVSQVAFCPEYLLAEMIQAIEIEIGKNLAGQVSERQTSTARIRGEQIIAREKLDDRFLRI